MVALKKHNNDDLINYLLEILKFLKNPILEEKDLTKLLKLLEKSEE